MSSTTVTKLSVENFDFDCYRDPGKEEKKEIWLRLKGGTAIFRENR